MTWGGARTRLLQKLGRGLFELYVTTGSRPEGVHQWHTVSVQCDFFADGVLVTEGL